MFRTVKDMIALARRSDLLVLKPSIDQSLDFRGQFLIKPRDALVDIYSSVATASGNHEVELEMGEVVSVLSNDTNGRSLI